MLKSIDKIENVFTIIDLNEDKYVNILREAVAIPSVSNLPQHRNDVIAMIKWMEHQLQKIGVSTEIVSLGTETLKNGETLPIPPILLGNLMTRKNKPTVLVYGHLDVHRAAREDGWSTHPFDLTIIDRKLYGRGTSDNKGPILCWLNSISAYKEQGMALPLNIKFLFESTEECGSIGLKNVLIQKKDTFFKNVNYICFCDCTWLGPNQPCLTYGFRGLCYFIMEVETPNVDDICLEDFNFMPADAMCDLLYLLEYLINDKLEELLSKISEDVKPVSDEEKENFFKIDFNVSLFQKSLGETKCLRTYDKVEILTNLWRRPSLCIHDVEGGSQGTGLNATIPKKVSAKFSLRLAPNQDAAKIERIIIEHMTGIWKQKPKSPNKFRIYMVHGTNPWETNPQSTNYEAATAATKYVYNVFPDYVMEKGKFPVVTTLEDVLGKNIIMLPIGAGDDGARMENEKLDLRNYIQGTKLIAAYIYELGGGI